MEELTVLIPAYKKNYIKDTISSLHNQKFKKFNIIVSDDSPRGNIKDEFEKQLKTINWKPKIQYHLGKRIGPATNIKFLLDIWKQSSDYVHILFDDDIIYPDFYQKSIDNIKKLKTSIHINKRYISNHNRTKIKKIETPKNFSTSETHKIEKKNKNLFHSVIFERNNWLGELSFAVFTKKSVESLYKGKITDTCFYGLNDIGSYLERNLHEAISFSNTELGEFRINPYQTGGNSSSFILQSASIAWLALAIDSEKENMTTPEITRKVLYEIRETASFINSKNNCFLELQKAINQTPFDQSFFQEKWHQFLKDQIDPNTILNPQ